MNYFSFLRPLLFLFPPEQAHKLVIYALKHNLIPKTNMIDYPRLHINLWNKSFTNPVGLAAGFDKDGKVIDSLLKRGFGFIETGGITPKPQAGNPKPRIFRLVRDQAIINSLGLNNEGLKHFLGELEKGYDGIVGVNIAKNKFSDEPIEDYKLLMQNLYNYCDYITINISSPNTYGLRKLQEKQQLEKILQAINDYKLHFAYQHFKVDDKDNNLKIIKEFKQHSSYTPILLKLSPDISHNNMHEIAELSLKYDIDGLIVSNTTTSRDFNLKSQLSRKIGGLSGKPLFEISTKLLYNMYKLTSGKIPLIGVGGISSAEDAYIKIRSGASLVQLYSALVYQGFGLVEGIKQGLDALLERDGFKSISEAVGIDVN